MAPYETKAVEPNVTIPLKPTPEILAAMLRAFTTQDIDEVLSGRYTIINSVEAAYAALVKEVSK